MPNLKKFKSPIFIGGLIAKLALISLVLPPATRDWYAPFLEQSFSQFSLNPWAIWIHSAGTASAFPYGYAMWLCFLPLGLFCQIFSLSVATGYGITLLLADVLVLELLDRLIGKRELMILTTYWLSPVVILATYVLGFNDLVPISFLLLALYFLRNSSFKFAGIFCVAAISAKLSMVLAIPFFVIYFFSNRNLRRFLPEFIIGLFLGSIALIAPFCFSSAGIEMIIQNPEIDKIYNLAIPLGKSISVYLVPLFYLVMAYFAWRVKRLNFELLKNLMGITFLAIVVMTPAALGWFVWAIPFLVMYEAKSDKVALLLSSCFSALYVVGCISQEAIRDYLILSSPPSPLLDLALNSKFQSFIHTAIAGTGIVLALRMWREGIGKNDYFRLSRKPFTIGIAGDSGAGKDTFSDSIRDLFGKASVATISGDDYHLWDRHKPMWQVMTHLNPLANDLENFANDLIALTDGKTIRARHYNHQTGRMSKLVSTESNDFIIASGLHALYFPALRELYDLNVYLDIDEDLRRHFKIKRDVGVRGHPLERVLSSFEKREPDAARFIRPQAKGADLIFSLQPIHPQALENYERNRAPLRLKLKVCSRSSINELSLLRVLVGVCGLHVDVSPRTETDQVEFIIEGEASEQDIELAAKMVCPRIFEFLDVKPSWKDGVTGLMQLITLSHINQALSNRFSE